MLQIQNICPAVIQTQIFLKKKYTLSAGSHYSDLWSDMSDLKSPQVAEHKKFH